LRQINGQLEVKTTLSYLIIIENDHKTC